MLSGIHKHNLLPLGLAIACLGLIGTTLTTHADSALPARARSVFLQSPTETPLAPCKLGQASLGLETSQPRASVENNYPYYLTFSADPGDMDISGQPDCAGRRLYTVDLARPNQSSVMTDAGSLGWAEGASQLSPDGRYDAFISNRRIVAQNEVTDQHLSLYIKDLQDKFSREAITAANVDFAWSPDGKSLAYVWQALDQSGTAYQSHVVVSNADGTGRREAALSIPGAEQTVLRVEGWSADRQYLAIRVGDLIDPNPDKITIFSLREAPGSLYFIAADKLNLMDFHATDVMAFKWAPKGHQFVYSDKTHVAVGSPELGENAAFNGESLAGDELSWSPDGQYVVAYNNTAKHTSLLSANGKTVANLDTIFTQFGAYNGWTGDGKHWLSVIAADKYGTAPQLVSVSMTDGKTTILAEHLIAPGFLDPGLSYLYPGDTLWGVVESPTGQLAMVTQHGTDRQTTNRLLMNSDGSMTHQLFAQDVNDESCSVSCVGSSLFWSPDGQYLMFWTIAPKPGSSDESTTTLYSVRSNGTQLKPIGSTDSQFDPAQVVLSQTLYPYWISNHQVLFSSHHGNNRRESLDLIDVATGKMTQLGEADLSEADAITGPWVGFPSPDGQTIFLTKRTPILFYAPSFLFDLQSYRAVLVNEGPGALDKDEGLLTAIDVDRVAWSPDSRFVAFFACHYDENTNTICGVSIYDRHGPLMLNIPSYHVVTRTLTWHNRAN